MPFIVPKFIERQSKIIGPLTFRQFVFVGGAAVFCFILYFTAPFQIFLLAAVVLGGGAATLAFLKIGGRSLPTVLGNFSKFFISPKIYIWKKKEVKFEVFKKEEEIIEEKEAELPLKIAEKSQLKKLRTQVETKTK